MSIKISRRCVMADSLYNIEYNDGYGPLATARVQYYYEVSYRNTSRTNLTVVDFNNNKILISPECDGTVFGREQLTIQFRSISGKPIDMKGNDTLMKGYTITIPMEVINTHYQIYIKELNVVICLSEHADLIRHPFTTIDYAKFLNDAEKEIRENVKDNCPTIRFSVNDPFKKLGTDVLYGVMFDEIFEIPVTNMIDKDGIVCIYATMSMGDEICTYAESLEPMVAEKDPVDILEMHNNLLLAVATTKREAKRFKRENRKITEQDMKNREKQITVEIEEKHRTIIEGLKVERDKLKITLDSVVSDRDRYKEQYNAIIADHKTQSDIESYRTARHENETKNKISDNNVKVSDNKVTETQFKLIHLIAAASVPVVIGGAFKLLELYIKSKTESK